MPSLWIFQTFGKRNQTFKKKYGSKEINEYFATTIKINIDAEGQQNAIIIETHVGYCNDIENLALFIITITKLQSMFLYFC